MEKPTNNDFPILEPLRQRWSPLAFSDKKVERETLLSLFEAARWAASCFGEQPWRFVVGFKGDSVFADLADTLVEANALWAEDAPVLFLTVAKTTFAHNGSTNRFAAYDLGQAMGQLTAQAASLGLYLHQMGGFDPNAAREVFKIGAEYEILAVTALGYLGDSEELPNDALRARHNSPERKRKPLSELVFGATFGEASPLVK